MEGRKSEREFYGQIIRRARRVRERAAEALRWSRTPRKKQEDLGEQPNAAEGRRRFRRRG